jgi:hypothetical protein
MKKMRRRRACLHRSICEALGLGYEPRPPLDPEHVNGLTKLCGDLMRLSELWKFWVNEQPDRRVSVIDVRQLLGLTMATRAEIADKVEGI